MDMSAWAFIRGFNAYAISTELFSFHVYEMRLVTLTSYEWLNPFKPNKISHSLYQLEQSISILRAIWRYFYFHSNFNRVFCKQTVQTLIRRPIMQHPIWVCTICICPTKRTLGIYGLRLQYPLNIAYPGIQIACWDDML